MKRWIPIVLIVGVLVAGTLPEAGAGPSGRRTKTRGVTFTTTFVDEGSTPTGPYACGPAQPSVCKARFEGSATMTGDLSTFVDYFGYLWFNPSTQALEAESWDHHTGTLEGCGEGSFVMHQTNFQFDPLSFNPATGTSKLRLDWTVLKGSGTGDFMHATGSGTADVDLHPNLANSGTYSGIIVCPEGTR